MDSSQLGQHANNVFCIQQDICTNGLIAVGTTCKQCLLYTAGHLHKWTHRSWDNMQTMSSVYSRTSAQMDSSQLGQHANNVFCIQQDICTNGLIAVGTTCKRQSKSTPDQILTWSGPLSFPSPPLSYNKAQSISILGVDAVCKWRWLLTINGSSTAVNLNFMSSH
ncbi:hypothetical protein STEG23_019243 [Scotinomys teguina]